MKNIIIKQVIKNVSYIIFFYTFLNTNIFSAQLYSGWQNPDIGVTFDAITDINNAKGKWLSYGLTLRSTEIIASGNIDPYASLTTNILVSQDGTELHEAFVHFPYLPLNLKLKGGLMLVNFGKWNQFHTHSMPFASKPRIYKEYADGKLALKGIELYFLAPLSNYLEFSFGIYNLIEGHSHDIDPPYISSELTPEKVAEMIEAIPHGDHYDYKGIHIYNIEDLYNIAGLPAPNDPEIYRGRRGPSDFAYGSRVTTSFDIGSDNSIDIGASVLYQSKWKKTKRKEYGFPEFYDKFLGGTDVVFFWHPLNQNRYKNLQTGLEFLFSKEYIEKIFPKVELIESLQSGCFIWFDYQHNPVLHIGTFLNIFIAHDSYLNKHHSGVYLTFSPTHYQYLRVEYSLFNYPQLLDKVSRILIQYNCNIGYHSHGRKR